MKVKDLFVDKQKLQIKIKEITKEIKNSFNFIKNIALVDNENIDLIIITNNIETDDFMETYNELYNFIAEKIDMGIDLLILEENEFEKEKSKFNIIQIV